jgi:hypothetical protein
MHETRIVAPGPKERTVRVADGRVLEVPPDWALLPPGDAALTRRVKAAGPTWTVQEKCGRKLFSRGVWAPAERIAAIERELAAERAAPSYAKRREADATRRQRKQAAYVVDFRGAVLEFLAFAPVHARTAESLAQAVADHATPVGSGTVARTERIPIERRAEAAMIAWLRHQTTAYDGMKISRVKGKRREVRRQLAEQSRRLLEAYRSGRAIDGAKCPIQTALIRLLDSQSSAGGLPPVDS